MGVLFHALRAAGVIRGTRDRMTWVAPRGTVFVLVGDLVDGFRKQQRQHQRITIDPCPSDAVEVNGFPVHMIDRRRREVTLTRNDGDDTIRSKDRLECTLADGDTCQVRVSEAEPPSRVDEVPGEELHLLQAVNDLKRQARRKGSAVVTIVGNHEVWTSTGNDEYATPLARDAWIHKGGAYRRIKDLNEALVAEGDVYAIVQIGDWVFAHAGVTERFLDKLARAVKRTTPDARKLSRRELDFMTLEVANNFALDLITASGKGGPIAAQELLESPQWEKVGKVMLHYDALWTTRDLGDYKSTPVRAAVEGMFRRLGLDPERHHMAFGHNVQSFRDSAAHPQYMSVVATTDNGDTEIYGGTPRVVRGKPHGINFALAQTKKKGGAATGMLYFVDVGASWAFVFSDNELTPDMLWARAPQVLLIDAEHDHVSVARSTARYNPESESE